MEKTSGTKEELIEEISDLKKKVKKLEKAAAQHKPIEKELHTSELKFRQLAEDMPALICTFLPDSTLTYVNAAYCKLFSKLPDELIGKKFLNFLPDEATREYVRRQYMSLTPENHIHTYEHEVMVADGTDKRRWHRWTDRALFNDNGQLSYFQSIGQDITENKLVEDALRESELKYRSVVEFSSDAIFCVDKKGQYKFTNSLFASTFGKSPEYFIGKTFWDIYPKEHADKRYEVTKRVFATGRSESVEVEVPLPDKTLYFYATADPIHDQTGKVILALTHAVNISERKQAEAKMQATINALRVSEASLEEAQRIARIGSWDWDMISNTVKWSKEMYRVFGISPDSFDGKPESLLKVIHPDDVDLFTNTMKSNLSKGNPTSLEFRVIHKSGSIHHIFAAGRVEYNKDGRPIRNIGTAQDITERKQAEEELQDAHRRLESIIEGTNVGTWEWNVQTGATVFNDVWAQIIGYTLDELKPISIKTWEKYSHPDDLAQSGELLERHFAGELPYYDCDCRMKHKDGHWVWVQDRGRVITRTADGKPLLMFGTHSNITERKQAEEELQESEFFMKTLLNSIPIPVFYKDRDGRYLGFNKAFETFFGATKEKLIGKTVFDINPPDLAAIYQAKDNELIESGGVQQYSSQVKNAIGTMCDVIFNKAVFTNSHGEISGQIGAILDISDRKKSDEALQESEEKFSKAFKTSPYAITITRPEDGKIMEVNDTFTSMTGLTREEALSSSTVGMKLWVSNEDRQFVVAALSKGQAIVGKEYQFRMKNGKIITGLFSAQSIKVSTGTCILSCIDDITDRRQAEEELQENEKHYRSLVEGMPGVVYRFSTKRGGLYYSSNVTNLLGCSPEQLYDRPQMWHDSIHPDDLSSIEQVIRETATGKPFCVTYRIRDAHGNWHWFEDRSFGYKVDGEDTIIEGLAFDITDHKQAESERKRLEAQLFQSQKMEAIGTLAGGIAHDFNNVLAVIIGYAELARDRNQKENKEQYLQEVLIGAERARSLVKQILTFSRKDDHEKKPLDIKILLKEAVKFLRASIPTTIEVNQQLTKETCYIMADPTQIHQVIMNLCTNASHAMKQTGGILTIELFNIELTKDEIPHHPDLQPGHYVKLTISDTGHGIDDAIVQRIFDPFFTTKSQDEGTGLGLSVVYGIVKGHDGAINVNSIINEGATFNIYLPRIIQMEATEANAGKPVIGGTELILFVDDEPSLVDIGMRMLFPLGYHVTGATSSKEALDIFRAEPQRFDLVITDMTLPKMTGIDLSRKLLQIRPDIPIILCSGIKEPGTEEQAKSLGIKAYLTKPLTRRELAGVMREVLDGRKED